VLFVFEQCDWPFIQAPQCYRESQLLEHSISAEVDRFVHTAHASCPEQKQTPINLLAEFIIFMESDLQK
jgi:hypothetical protein